MSFAALTLALASALPGMAAADDDYPSRAITLVVPYPPGGTADIIGRLVASGLGPEIKQSIIVKNLGGAAGNIAGQSVKNSTADGYTLIVGNAPLLAINPHLFKDPGFDPVKDFDPITPVAEMPLFLIANKSAPFKTVAEFVDWEKKNPKKATYASGSVGSTTNLAMQLFMKEADFRALQIPYKGSGPALAALAAGQVPIMFELLPSAMGFIKSGTVNALAVTSRSRQPTYPDVPTIAESGYPGFNVSSWFGILAPAGTPKSVIAFLNAAIHKVVSTPQFKARLLQLGAAPMQGGPEEFSKLIKDELQKWGPIVKSSGAKVE